MHSVKVFYTERQTAARNESFSPSAQKPALVVQAWSRLGSPDIELVEPAPAELEDLSRAHDGAYVEGVLAGTIPNGFGNTLPEVAETLPWTNGSILSAARHAVEHGESVFSPTSGFHHAGWDRGYGFCTFNGLMVAALAVRADGVAERVAILDCDRHYGDGTDEIIDRRGADWVAHYTFGAEHVSVASAESWLERLPDIVDRTVEGCAVALYQAGADPHVDDPLGGILTSQQLARRDRIVYQRCRAMGVPVVTNLAGGYQRPVERVVEIHVETLRQFAAVHG